MDFSLLFDGDNKINVRGLLAAIPVPLFLLLVYNLGIIALVTIGWIGPYHNIAIVWLIDSINWFLFFYAAYRAAKLYKLGLISSILTSSVCLIILLAVTYYVTYYLFINEIGGLGKHSLSVADQMYNSADDILEYNSLLTPIWQRSYLCIIKASGGGLQKVMCDVTESAIIMKFLFAFPLLLIFGFAGWFVGKGYSTVSKFIKDIFSPKNLKR